MLLLSTSSLEGYGLHRIFNFVKKSKYDGIDLVLSKGDYDNWDKNYVKSLSDFYSVPILSITAPTRDLDEKLVDEIVEIALLLKAQNITFSPPYIADKNISWYKEYLAKIKKITGLSISIKNVEPKFIFYIIPEYRASSFNDIKKLTGDTSLDISSIDSSSSMDIFKAYKIFGVSLKNIYFSDKKGTKKDVLPGLAGGGTSNLPLESFLMKLKATGYQNFITLKVNPKELGVGNEIKVLTNLQNFKHYYEKHFEIL